MRFVEVVVMALALSGCTYVTIVNGDDAGAPDAAPDHALGVALDAGKDAIAVDACPFPPMDPSTATSHMSCTPVADSLCPPPKDVCGASFATHYMCQNGNTPMGTHDDAGAANNLTCIAIDENDFCCVENVCVHSFGESAGCSAGPQAYYACPADAGSPTGFATGCSAAGNGPNSGASWWCCDP